MCTYIKILAAKSSKKNLQKFSFSAAYDCYASYANFLGCARKRRVGGAIFPKADSWFSFPIPV